ncbi:serine hydrolase domain-containing protein [Altererythrobacter sp. MF3-039]|uniref:serine hydrolase domain-containing protein n=1 Tax=Altererythrobacter sp. MF3-039 TaxID=3252901 RepID=UPI00390C7ACD
MNSRPRLFDTPLIAMLALLPALAGCESEPPGPRPLSEAALASVTEDAGAPAKQVAREVDDLFTMEGLGETRALVVMQNGKIAAERYAPGYGADTRFVSWSMAKTVTAVMIGMLVGEGRLQLDESAPVPRWQRPGDPRAEITLRQLLQMRSGLRHTELEEPFPQDLTVRMLFLDGRDNMADFATSQPLEYEPGSTFEYSTNTSVILADIAARALTDSDAPEDRSAAVDAYLQSRLFEQLGMDSAVPEYDASGTLIGGSLIHATARDWAKFGEFLRRKGSHQGVQLVPRNWIAFMTSPNPRKPDYGAHVYLNRDNGTDRNLLFPDRAPDTLFALSGHMGQFVLVSPEQRLTIARLGHTNGQERDLMMEQLGDIVELYPVR